MILKFSMDIDFSNNLIPVRKKLLVSSEFYYIRKLNFGINDDQALFDFYLENKLEEEQLGIATLNFSEISTFPYTPTKLKIESKIWFNHIYGLEVEKMELGRYPNVERFVRLVMLAQYYLQHKKFRDPIFAYRCIYTNKYVVHPGHGRMYINRMFNTKQKDNFIVFYSPDFKIEDTQPPKFKKIFNSWKRVVNTFQPSDTSIGLYTGNQTIIPQIYITRSLNGYRQEVLKYMDNLATLFKTTKFNANFDLSKYGYSINESKGIRSISITVSNPEDIELCNKSFILASIGKNYNDEQITISVG